jgi:ABC-type transport system involved in multi-copper enzyme maturation permease subunit
MIWMTWRQFRAQAITAGTIMFAVAIALGISGAALISDYDGADLNACHLSCGQDATNFLNSLRGSPYQALFYGGIALMYLAPALIGLFWGAPLIARELETGTYRLAWNQSVTRDRWTLVKLGVGALASVVVAGLLSLMITWWASPISAALNHGSSTSPLRYRLEPLMFAARGVAPLGYAAFAFALGVTLGLLLRRTLPAMALTLVLFAAVQLLVPAFVRPHLLPARQVTAPLNPASVESLSISGPSAQMTLVESANVPGAWILSNQTITPAGQVFTGPATQACLGPSNGPCWAWIASKHLRQLVTYQPASRFWPLQLIETATYLVASAGLGGICVWQIRRKRA